MLPEVMENQKTKQRPERTVVIEKRDENEQIPIQ